MSNTKHDACGSEVKLDYGELVETAKIAVAYTRDQLNRDVERWYLDPGKEYPSPVYADAMQRDASALATAAKTLHYLLLQEGRSYSIVNAPEVTKE